MQPEPHIQKSVTEQRFFLLLLVLATAAFGWILLPFYGAVFWGAVLAIVFAPLNRLILARIGRRPTVAALLTLLVILVLVILPLAMITGSLVKEGTALYGRMKDGGLSLSDYANQIYAALPSWLTDLLHRFGLDNLYVLQQRMAEALNRGGQKLAQQALNFGQNTLDFVIGFFVMLYLLFFLLRDGQALMARMRRAAPLDGTHMRLLGTKFATVVRAAVKGNIAVAAVQGLLGGLAFWALGIPAPVLWAVLMAFLSLLPAVGAGLVWGPVALYLLATGAMGQGIGLVVFGVLVVGMVDNVLRPILVGKDTRMPDYLILIATLGGMAVFGLNGFVIGPLIAAMFIAVWDIFATERGREGPPASPGPMQVPGPDAPPPMPRLAGETTPAPAPGPTST